MDTYGAEAAALMERARKAGFEWQRHSLDLMLGLRNDGKWACYEYAEWVPRQNGKGVSLEARVLTGLLLLGERLILWTAHEYKTSMEAFRRVRELIHALGSTGTNENLVNIDGIYVKIINTNGEEGFEVVAVDDPDEKWRVGARIRFIARSKSSGRGFTANLLILDEAFALTDEQMSAILFALSAVKNPQIIYTSSPPLTSDTGEVMYRLRRRGDPTLEREPEDGEWVQEDALGYRDWGIGGDLDHLDDIDVHDPDLAAASNPSLGILITMETVRREARSMSTVDFARERLGVWPIELRNRNRWGVVTREQWETALDRLSHITGPLVFAIDVRPDRGWTSIAVAGARPDKDLHVEVVATDAGTGWVVPWCRQRQEMWRPVRWVLDPSEALRVDLEAEGFEVEPINGADAAQAYGLIVDGLTRQGPTVDPVTGEIRPAARRVWHLDDPALSAAMAAAKTRSVGVSGKAWDCKNAPVDMTRLVSVTRALWGFVSRPVSPPAAFPTTPPNTAGNPFRQRGRLKI